MTSAAGDTVRLAALAGRAPSLISHHGRACCDMAANWVLALDASAAGGPAQLGPPAWLGERWMWGPSPWPLHWCELVERERLDCGALAAVAKTVLAARGRETAAVQLLQRYPRDDAGHWRSCWARNGLEADWIVDDIVYHEAVALIDGELASVWDPSDTAWLSPVAEGGYGECVGVRMSRGGPGSERLRWDAIDVTVGEWVALGWSGLPSHGGETAAGAPRSRSGV